MLKQWISKVAGILGLKGSRRWYRRKVNAVLDQQIAGAALKVPRIGGLFCEGTEPWMTELLGRILRFHKGLFLDVGVNLGQTLLKLKAQDPEREYVGLEPNPTCVFYVQQLIKANAFQNCTLLPSGLFTRDGLLSLDFYADNEGDASASLIENFRPKSSVKSRAFVPVIRAETLAGVLGDRPLGIVKIDVEGAELEVLETLQDLIRRDQPLILMEVLPVYSEENAQRKTRQDMLEQLVADCGYVLFRVKQTETGLYAGLTRLETIGIHGDLRQCEYVLVPEAQADAVAQAMGRN